MILISAGYGLILSTGYIVDRLLVHQYDGFLRTLIFPLTVTTVDWILNFTPFYTYGSSAYTQRDLLPLIQMISITGMWGLTFLIAWFGPVVNDIWEQEFNLRSTLRTTIPFALVFIGVILYGSIRIAFAPPSGPTVQVSGITPDQTLWSYQPVAEIAQGTEERRAELHTLMQPVLTDLFDRSRQLARAGSKIVVWSETAAFVLEEEEASVLNIGQDLAREEGIYLQMGLMVVLKTEHHPFGENRVILIDPNGNIVWDYYKSHPVPLNDATEIAPGPGIIPMVDSPYGRIATLICYDANDPRFVRQAGKGGASLLLDPADDWEVIKFDHSRMAVYRAIENGVSLLRPTSKGLLTAVDYQGKTLAYSDYYKADKAVITTAVPISGVSTLYTYIGDSFAYSCIIGLTILIISALIRK